jgi:Phosphoglycerol transferase and related proteins, alkaline phosphatase superfamily
MGRALQFDFKGRYTAVLAYVAVFVALSALVRLALLWKQWGDIDAGVFGLLQVFAVGVLYDLITANYFALPFVLYLLLIPEVVFRHRLQRALLELGYVAAFALLLFIGMAEWLFWDEFGSRFNFVAVDYLIYTQEVIGNIRESYPLTALLSGIAVAAATLHVFIRRRLLAGLAHPTRFAARLRHAAGFIGAAVLATALIDSSLAHVSENRYENELASNGPYSFFAAFRNNELDYNTFYRTEPEAVVQQHLERLVGDGGDPAGDGLSAHHLVHGHGAERRLNVMLVVVESLSAEFLGAYGDERGLTPHLDAIAADSLHFTRLYATGTRTVRGLEAVTLSLPPTPGSSIVKRPNNGGLFSAGFLFRERGYDTRFLYGGYGYFDNMNAFFAGNGYEVVDRTDMDETEAPFATIWGVADEYLFNRALAEADRSHAAGRPFFQHLLTTSNHRPYTYPDGRIDIPSGTGREGAVKYTDWALGNFIAQARQHPWFDDTIFVIVADHCASSAGRAELEVARYRIPLLVYAPRHIRPQQVDTLASQIDVMPTVLGLLDFSYDSKFFGQDLLAAGSGGRAFIGNYQKLGYLHGDRLTVLSPQQAVSAYTVDAGSGRLRVTAPDAGELADTVALYQGASALYHRGRQAWGVN